MRFVDKYKQPFESMGVGPQGFNIEIYSRSDDENPPMLAGRLTGVVSFFGIMLHAPSAEIDSARSALQLAAAWGDSVEMGIALQPGVTRWDRGNGWDCCLVSHDYILPAWVGEIPATGLAAELTAYMRDPSLIPEVSAVYFGSTADEGATLGSRQAEAANTALGMFIAIRDSVYSILRTYVPAVNMEYGVITGYGVEALLDAAESQLANLNAEIADKTAQLAALEGSLAEAQQATQQAEEALAQAQSLLSALQAQLDLKQEEMANLDRDIVSLSADRSNLQVALEGVRLDLRASYTRLTQAEDKTAVAAVLGTLGLIL